MPTSDPDCPFCTIVAGQSDTREIYRDADTVAFFPTDPATLGHTLVIPRTHILDIWDLDLTVATAVTATTLTIARAVRAAVNPDGLNVIQSNGAAATQTVPHLHVHVLPRWHGDPIGDFWPATSDYSDRTLDQTQEDVRGAVDRYLAPK